MSSHVGDRAIVLGGSMAGMFVARVLSDVFTEVLVVDRDALDGVREGRRGVPQGRHAHGLLARGQEILEDFFPGFTAELIAADIPVGDLGGQVRWYFDGHRIRPSDTGLRLVGVARPVLEDHVRGRVRAIHNVTFVDSTDVIGPVATAGSDRVTGVRVQGRGPGAVEEVLDADLVVDATGKGSRAPGWLASLGYGNVKEDRVKVGLAYTSRRYRFDVDPFRGDMSINPVATPANPRGAFLHTLGGGFGMLSLTGILGDHPPTDEAGFLAFAKSLPVPDVHDAIVDAEPIGAPVTFKYPASQRRRFEKLSRLPQGFLVAGDAVCSFNPVYGQGMASAALQALTLREHLQAGIPDPRAFFKDIAKVVDVPWEISAGGDLAFPEVEGKRTLKVRMANAFMARLQTAATHDAGLGEAFLRVAGLIDPPQSLMRPSMVLRTLRTPRTPAGDSRPEPGPRLRRAA
ncbi:FAD-binding monooxygenase [Amycolatopsis sp. H6(2020)]|nr:FAD-binding monooxygenase [Amycolatopsis sp. H6(2020)]